MNTKLILASITVLNLALGSLRLGAETITGTFSYQDRHPDGTLTMTRPIAFCRVEVWAFRPRGTGVWTWAKDGGDELTDASGSFSVSRTFQVSGVKYGVKVFAENYAVIVQDISWGHDPTFHQEPGQPDNAKFERTVATPGDVLDFSYVFRDFFSAQHYNLAETLRRGFDYVAARRDPGESDSLPAAKIKPSPVAVGGYYNHLEDRILLQPAMVFEDLLVLHEYAHFVEDQISGFAPIAAGHDGCLALALIVGTVINSPEHAWMEGFAGYFAQAVAAALPGGTFESTEDNGTPGGLMLENWANSCTSLPGWITPDAVELNVAAALWDLADAPGTCLGTETHDTLAGFDREIIQILDRELDTSTWPTIAGFHNAWLARGLPRTGLLESLRRQAIEPPLALVFLPPANVTVNAPVDACDVSVAFPLPALNEEGRNCVVVNCVPSSGSFFPIGVSPVTCQALRAGTAVANCTFQVIVGRASDPGPGGTGLLAIYYDSVNFTIPTVTRVEPVNFEWSTAAPVFGLGADNFAVRWSGQIIPRFTDFHRFYVGAWAFDGVRLWVDGQLLVDRPAYPPPRPLPSFEVYSDASGVVALTAGRRYDIVLEYLETDSVAAVQLSWSSACQPKEIIPASRLFPEPPKCATGCSSEFISDFNTAAPSGLTIFGDAAIQNGWLQLTTADNSYGIAHLDDFSCGRPVTSFQATFKAALFGSTCCGGGMLPADGFSFNLVPAATVRANPGYGQPAEEGLDEGLAVNFDTWDNGFELGFEDGAPAIEVKWLGQVIARTRIQSSQSPAGISDPNAAARDVIIHLAEDGRLNVSYGGASVLVNVQIPANPGILGTPVWVLGARNGGANDNHWIRDLRIVARTRAGLPIPGLLNTGVDAYGALLPAGAVNPHYRLAQSADPSRPGPDSVVVQDSWPLAPAGPWLANGPRSKWIAPQPAQNVGSQAGDYTYEIDFDLTGLEPATAVISGHWATDDPGLDILVNGQSTGQGSVGFTVWTPFQITTGFKPGINRLAFVLRNAGTSINPTGLRVEMCGTAVPRCLGFEQFQPMPLPNPWTLLGNSYRVYNFDGSPFPNPAIRTDSGAGGLRFTGMECGSRLEIDLAQPCYAADLRLVHFVAAGSVTAYNARGDIVSARTMTAPAWMPETVSLTGAGITRLVVTAPRGEVRLLNLCARAEYPPRPIQMNISRQHGQIVLCWNSRPGKTYCVEYRTDLTGPWRALPGGCITASDILTCKVDASPGSGRARYYRVVEQP